MPAQPPMLPKGFKSKAFRVKTDDEEQKKPAMVSQQVSTRPEVAKILTEVTPEEEIKLTTEQITNGVEQARDAVNAAPLDVIAFEEQLKKKHNELKAAGITPVLNVPPQPKYKVGI